MVWRRVSQKGRTATVKALRQEPAWWDWGTSRMPAAGAEGLRGERAQAKDSGLYSEWTPAEP